MPSESVIVGATIAGILVLCGTVARELIYRQRLAEFKETALKAQTSESQSEAVAAESVAKLNSILSISEDAILQVDGNGICSVLNRSAAELFPAAAEQTLLSLSQSAELDNLLQKARKANDPLVATTGEVHLRFPKDRTMQVLISPVPRFETEKMPGSKQSQRMMIVLRDVTDLRRLETVRRDFVANVSHELRTPLSSIMAMAETLRDGAIDDKGVAHHFLNTIVHEADRLVRLAADLLDLSRVEAQSVSKSEHDIASLIDDVAMRLSSQRSKAGLSISLDFERPLMVPCDRDEIAQVLVNLLDNAIKYTPRGGLIDIRAFARPDHLSVEVSDTGIGILQQDLTRLFERFYRTDKARSRASGGTGLGLSIVKHIVERHGGELWVKSEYNRGSTFGFSLPCDPNVFNVRVEPLLAGSDMSRHSKTIALATNEEEQIRR